MPTHCWLSVGDTHLLMQLQNAGELPEWHPVAQVTRRQIYASVPQMWYAWSSPGGERVSKWETLEEAVSWAEALAGIQLGSQ